MATKVKLIADGVITPDQITLTTASTGTNTTAPATTAFVQQEISALVDSSPEALNTLNELAAALGDDANFSTTVTNSIATKLPLAGGTMTGPITMSQSGALHNQFISIGASSKISIISADGEQAYINYSGATNEMSAGYDRTSSSFRFTNADNLSSAIRMQINSAGNVGIGTDSPDSKLTVNVTTNSDGIELQSSEVKIATLARTLVDSQVVASLDGVASRPIHIGGIVNEDVILANAGGNVGIGTTDPQEKLQINGNLRMFSAGYPLIDIGITTSNYFRFLYDNPNDIFKIGKNGAATLNIGGSGNVGIGTDSPSSTKKLHVYSGNSGASDYGVPGLAIENDTNVSLQFMGGASHQLGITFSDSGDTEAGYIYYNTGTQDLKIKVEDDIIFNSGTTEIMRIDGANNRVGIGRTDPTQLLEVHKNAGGDQTVAKFSAHNYGDTGKTFIEIGTEYGDGSSRIGSFNDTGNNSVLVFDVHSATSGQFSEKMRIKSDGQITTQGDILPGADIIMANGRGISFAATANSSGSMSNELLDDYEEGTFTLSVSNGTLSYLYSSISTYTKIGNRVFIDFGQLQITGTNTGSSALVLTGLPFTTTNQSSGVIGFINMPYGTSAPDLVGNFYIESNLIYFGARRGDYLLRNTDFNGQSVAFSASAVYKTTQ